MTFIFQMPTKAEEIAFDYYLTNIGIPRETGTSAFISQLETAFPLGAQYRLSFNTESLELRNDLHGCGAPRHCYLGIDLNFTGPGLEISPPHPDITPFPHAPQGRNLFQLFEQTPFQDARAGIALIQTNFKVFGRDPSSRLPFFLTRAVPEVAFLNFRYEWQPSSNFDPGNPLSTNGELTPQELHPTSPAQLTLQLIDFDEPDASFTQSTSIPLRFSPGGREYIWSGGFGDFSEAAKWPSNDGEIPGSGTTPFEVVRITENGNYTVTGNPDEKLLILNVGSDVGRITLGPMLDKYHVEQFLVDGDVLLEFGEIDVDSKVSIAKGAKLSIGQNGVLAADEGATASELPEFSIAGELEIDGGNVLASSIDVAEFAGEGASVTVSGLSSGLDIKDNLDLAAGDNSEATLQIGDGAQVTIGSSIELASGVDSKVNALITGNITTVRGESPTDGVNQLIIGSAGEATLEITDAAIVSINEQLSLGGFASANANLEIRSVAKLLTPDLGNANANRSLEVNIGEFGEANVTVASGGEFFTTTGLSNGKVLIIAEHDGSRGKLDIDHFAGNLVDENLFTDFTDTTVGAGGSGELFIGEQAKWHTENFVIGETLTGDGTVSVVGATAEIGLYGSRLLVVGGEGKGSLTIRDGASVKRLERTGVAGDGPVDILVGFNQSTNPASGELIVSDAVLAGGAGSSLKIGATASGALGRAEFSDAAVIDIDSVYIGFNSLAPGEVAPEPPIFEETIREVAASLRSPQATGATISAVEFFPSNATTETTGALTLSNQAFLTTDNGLGSLIVGSRGYLSVESGARIETGLLQIGIEQADVDDIADFTGKGAVVNINGPGTRVDTVVLNIGPADAFTPGAFLEGNDVTIADRAELSASDVRIDGRTNVSVSTLGAVTTETLLIGGRREAPTPGGRDGLILDENLTSVAVTAGGIINSALSITIGDDTRAGAFEPLATFAILSIDEFSDITTEHLIVANGGALFGSNNSVNATTTEVFAGAIAPGFSPGTLNFNGDLILHDGARIIIEIGGDDPSLVDQISVAGAIIGEATLDLRFVDGFVPEVGAEFNFFEAAESSSPTFDEVLISGLGEGAVVDFSNVLNLSGVLTVMDIGTVSAVPLPPAILMLIGGFLILVRQGTCRSRLIAK